MCKKETMKNGFNGYSDAEKELLLNSFDNIRDKVIFLLALNGFRLDEILSLKVSDIGYDYKTLNVKHSNFQKDVAFISRQCSSELFKYIECVRSDEPEHIFNQNSLIFGNYDKEENTFKPMTSSEYKKILKSVAEKIGMEESEVTIMKCRNTRLLKVTEMIDEHGMPYGLQNYYFLTRMVNHNGISLSKKTCSFDCDGGFSDVAELRGDSAFKCSFKYLNPGRGTKC